MFKTGKQASISDVLAGHEKVTKDSVVITPIVIERVVKGTSAEYGEFVFILGDQNGKKVFVPSSKSDTDNGVYTVTNIKGGEGDVYLPYSYRNLITEPNRRAKLKGYI